MDSSEGYCFLGHGPLQFVRCHNFGETRHVYIEGKRRTLNIWLIYLSETSILIGQSTRNHIQKKAVIFMVTEHENREYTTDSAGLWQVTVVLQ